MVRAGGASLRYLSHMCFALALSCKAGWSRGRAQGRLPHGEGAAVRPPTLPIGSGSSLSASDFSSRVHRFVVGNDDTDAYRNEGTPLRY